MNVVCFCFVFPFWCLVLFRLMNFGLQLHLNPIDCDWFACWDFWIHPIPISSSGWFLGLILDSISSSQVSLDETILQGFSSSITIAATQMFARPRGIISTFSGRRLGLFIKLPMYEGFMLKSKSWWEIQYLIKTILCLFKILLLFKF